MKTKSLLFAALVSISFATTSCQKEESITPSIDYYSNDKNTNTTVIIDEKEAVTDEHEASQPISDNTNSAKPKSSNQPKSTLPTNIMQIDSDEVK